MHRHRSNWKIIQDLELRLGPSPPLKGGSIPAINCGRGISDLIIIEDDDDDVQMVSPRYSARTLSFFPRMSSWVPVISDEDLELWLGLRAHNGSPSGSVDITNDGAEDPLRGWKCFKEVKLRCSICMDTMEEETSTVCGHVFCKPCISNAIRVQRKCPTCREKLSLSSIHRIYLPGATS